MTIVYPQKRPGIFTFVVVKCHSLKITLFITMLVSVHQLNSKLGTDRISQLNLWPTDTNKVVCMSCIPGKPYTQQRGKLKHIPHTQTLIWREFSYYVNKELTRKCPDSLYFEVWALRHCTHPLRSYKLQQCSSTVWASVFPPQRSEYPKNNNNINTYVIYILRELHKIAY